MNKRIISIFLCAVLLISLLPVVAHADEITFYQVKIDAGNGVQTEKAIIEDGEIFIPADSFRKYTRFEFHLDSQTFLVKGQEADKAFKKVIVNAETKKAAVGTKMIELSNSFVVDGVPYLPFCQMLPILNADIIEVDSDVIYVVNNELSMAELLYDFDIDDYWFNISEEFFGRTDLLYWYIAPSYLFDTVVNFRFDRLDIVFESGTCEDYQTILTNYLKDDELFHKAMSEDDFAGELLESITGLTGITGKLDDVYDWFDKIEKIDYDPLLSDKLVKFFQKTSNSEVFDDQLHTWIEVIHGDIVEVGEEKFSAADILEGIDFIYTYLNQVEDHQKMLDAVYSIVDYQNKLESIPGASSSFTSVDPEYLAAEQVYELYTGKIMPAVTKKAVEKTAEKLMEDFIAVKALGIYSLTAGLAGEILELYLPGDSGDRALLTQHSNIANSAMRKAAVPTLDTEASTDEYRLSLLLTLLASRACYDIMAETASGYGQDVGYYKQQVDEIENMIMGLYLVAENVAFDTYENYESFMEQNQDTIAQSALLDRLVEYKSYYEEFLKQQGFSDYYATLDINGDGLDELLLTDMVWTESNSIVALEPGCAVAYGYVEVYAFGNDCVKHLGDVTECNTDYFSFSPKDHCLYFTWSGAGYTEDIACTIVSDEITLGEILAIDLSSGVPYYNNEEITVEKYNELSESRNKNKEYIIFYPNIRESDVLSDGEYAVSFSTEDLVENAGDLYLTFTYYEYYVHDKEDILSLEPGDTVSYCGEDILVETVDIYSWEYDGIQMNSVYINEYDAGFETYTQDPSKMIDVETWSEGECYNEIDTITLKVSESMCFYDQSQNPSPEMAAVQISYAELYDYFVEGFCGGFATAIVKNNEIVVIENQWSP